MDSSRNEAQVLRKKILNEVNRVINATCQLHKEFRSKFMRCYYVVSLADPKRIKVMVLSSEAPLDPMKRVLLSNKELYGLSSYYGNVKFDGTRCRFKREVRIKESVTYAEGQVLIEFRLKDLSASFSKKDVLKAFGHYKEEMSHGQKSLF